MSDSKVIKYIARLQSNASEISTHPRPVILVSDSKGFQLQSVDSSESGIPIRYISKASEIIEHIFHSLSLINQENKPIVLIWLGTCDLTEKRGKFLYLKNNLPVRIGILSKLYHTIKAEILAKRPDCTVLFLPCPDLSIIEWNKSKGHNNPESFLNDQCVLEQHIKLLNKEFFAINESSRLVAPSLNRDLIRSTKRSKHTKYKINFNLLRDGVHPKHNLALLWLLRIQDCVRRISDTVLINHN